MIEFCIYWCFFFSLSTREAASKALHITFNISSYLRLLLDWETLTCKPKLWTSCIIRFVYDNSMYVLSLAMDRFATMDLYIEIRLQVLINLLFQTVMTKLSMPVYFDICNCLVFWMAFIGLQYSCKVDYRNHFCLSSTVTPI